MKNNQIQKLTKEQVRLEQNKFRYTELKALQILRESGDDWIYSPVLTVRVWVGCVSDIVKHLREKGILIDREISKQKHGRVALYRLNKASFDYVDLLIGGGRE